MRKSLKALGHSVTFCIEIGNKYPNSNQLLHIDFNIYNNKGDDKQ